MFDWSAKKVWLMKLPVAEQKKNEWSSFRFAPALKDGKLLVVYTYDNSPAQMSGIKPEIS